MPKKTGRFVYFAVFLLVFFGTTSLAFAQRQLVKFDNRKKWFGDSAVWGETYDEATNSLYIKVWLEVPQSPWKKRGGHILRANRVGSDKAHFIIPDDQSELDEINSFKINGRSVSVTQPRIINTPVGKYMFFVTGGLHSSRGENSDIHVAKWNKKLNKWQVNKADEEMLKSVNTVGLECLPCPADKGLTLYFTSDTNRPCKKGKCACDNAFIYLAGTCFSTYKYTRDSYDKPFEPKGDGLQVSDTGGVTFLYLKDFKMRGKVYKEINQIASVSVSDNGIVFFNGLDPKGKDWDNIWMARWDGKKFLDAKYVPEIDDASNEGIKEYPEVLKDGSGIYWASGRLAITTQIYFLDLKKLKY